MLSWLPIVGPIIEGIVSIFTKASDTALGKYKEDTVRIKTETEASTQTLVTFKDDIGVRLSRDLIMFPVAAWTALTTWDTIVEHHYPNLVFVTGAFKQGSGLEFLPYAVLTFLFGTIAMNAYRRR